MIKPKVVLLIFVSGKIVLTGAKVTNLCIDAVIAHSHLSPGPRGNLHRIQHDLYSVVRVPETISGSRSSLSVTSMFLTFAITKGSARVGCWDR